MTIPSMNKLSTVFPIMIDKYEQFIPNIEGMGVPDKINAIIQYLNRIGKLSNDVVADWNKVMVWVMDEGLNESVISKVDDLISKGTFDDLLNGMFDEITTSNSNFQDSINTKIQNQSKGSPSGVYATLSALQTAFPSGNSNVYVVTADGKWYYWDSTAWTVGGTYQSTAIENNSVTTSQRTILGTSVVGFATSFDYSTTAKTLTYTGLWINYNNKSIGITNGSLDLSISTVNSVIVFDSSTNTIKNLGDSTIVITENQILIGVINLNTPVNSIMYTNVFTVNGKGVLDSTKLSDNAVTSAKLSDNAVTTAKVADGSITFAKRAPLGSVGFAYGTFTWNTDSKTLTWTSDAWVNFGKGVGYAITTGSLSIANSCFVVYDTVSKLLTTLSNYNNILDTHILLCYLNITNWDKSFNICIGRLLLTNSKGTQSLEDAKHWDTPISSTRLPIPVTNNKKFACFGDSITSDQVSGTGTSISGLLSDTLIGNFATGWATCSDWHTGTTNNTVITLTTPNNTDTNDNVLSNQIRRMLQRTTPSGSQITWTHPIDGLFSLDTSVGTGLGFTTDIPDIIYIAISTNDGKNASVPINDDTDVVFGQTYSQLTRNSIASALRWAIETLQCVYPKANIFVASPLQANSGNSWMSFTNNKLKRDIIQKVCQFTSVHFIDSFNDSGFSTIKAKSGVLTVDGIHPNTDGKTWINNFVVNKIKNWFISR